MSEPRWTDAPFLIAVNRRLVEHTGEPFLLRDENLLESALAVPRNRWHYEKVEDIGVLGVALAVAVAKNHPFGQGNKRTAWSAMLAFFALNGVTLGDLDEEEHAEAFVEVLTGTREADTFLAGLDLRRR